MLTVVDSKRTFACVSEDVPDKNNPGSTKTIFRRFPVGVKVTLGTGEEIGWCQRSNTFTIRHEPVEVLYRSGTGSGEYTQAIVKMDYAEWRRSMSPRLQELVWDAIAQALAG